MKLKCFILLKNNTIIKRSVTNPSLNFNVRYPVDGEQREFTYNFDRKHMYSIKRFLGTDKVCFYEHSNPDPLDASFKTKELELKDINRLAESSLIGDLINSTKQNKEKFTLYMVLGLAAIAGLVCIVVFG